MHKIIVLGVTIFLTLILGFLFLINKPTPLPPPTQNASEELTAESSVTPITDIDASFAIFTNGTFRIFTSPMYHNISPDVYIEPTDPNTVHVKKVGITWNDFFLTLPFKLNATCLTTGTNQTFCTGENGTLKFFINGEQNNAALSEEIKNGDRLLVTFGSESEEEIKQQLNTEVLR